MNLASWAISLMHRSQPFSTFYKRCLPLRHSGWRYRYASLMCVGLGDHLRRDAGDQFRLQGDFLMVGMYAAFYLTTGFGILSFLGPDAGPIVAAFLAGPIVFALAGCGNKAVYRAFPARFARRRGFWRGPVDRICSHLVPDPEARPRQQRIGSCSRQQLGATGIRLQAAAVRVVEGPADTGRCRGVRVLRSPPLVLIQPNASSMRLPDTLA